MNILDFGGCGFLAGQNVLAQEIGHRWLSHVSYQDAAGQASTALLGRQSAHWTTSMNSDGSVMDGVGYVQESAGRYRLTQHSWRYGVLDQYLMGLRPPDEVTDIFLLRTPGGALAQPPPFSGVGSEGGPPLLEGEMCPFVGGVIDDVVAEPVAMNAIIAVEGNRGVSPSVFRHVFALLVPPGETPDPQDVARLNEIRANWSGTFHRATDGRGRAETCLHAPCDSCGNGVMGPDEACDGTNLGGATCSDFGLPGTLACGLDCRVDLSGCTAVCGNGVEEGAEQCDGADHGGVTCTTAGFRSGPIGCHPDCSFDFSECIPFSREIRGTKVDANGALFDAPVIRLNGASPTTANPYSFTRPTPLFNQVSTSEPAGFQASYSVCENCTTHTTFTTGTFVHVQVPPDGFVDVQWRYTPLAGSQGAVQGIKIDANNQSFTGATLTLDGGSPTTANPYAFSGIPFGSHTIASTVPGGFAVSHAVCVNCTNTPSSTFTAGSSVTVTVPAGGFVDVWWKYTPTNPGAVPGHQDRREQSNLQQSDRDDRWRCPTTANPVYLRRSQRGIHTRLDNSPQRFHC